MAVPAGLARGGADTLGHGHQIHLGIGHAGRRGGFFVGPGGVVTHQAVDLGHVGKVEAGVFPSVSGVATGAARLVAGQTDAEIVGGQGGFAQLDRLSMVEGIGRRSLPQPVGRLEHVLAGLLMAAQTLAGDLGGLRVGGQLDLVLVVGSVFPMAAGTVDGPLVHLPMAAHALLMISRLEPQPLGMIFLERLLVTGRTPCGFRCALVHGTIMMAQGAVLCDRGVLGVHEAHRPVMVFGPADDGAVQQIIAFRLVLDVQTHVAQPLLAAQPTLVPDRFHERNHFGRPFFGRFLIRGGPGLLRRRWLLGRRVRGPQGRTAPADASQGNENEQKKHRSCSGHADTSCSGLLSTGR